MWDPGIFPGTLPGRRGFHDWYSRTTRSSIGDLGPQPESNRYRVQRVWFAKLKCPHSASGRGVGNAVHHAFLEDGCRRNVSAEARAVPVSGQESPESVAGCGERISDLYCEPGRAGSRGQGRVLPLTGKPGGENRGRLGNHGKSNSGPPIEELSRARP